MMKRWGLRATLVGSLILSACSTPMVQNTVDVTKNLRGLSILNRAKPPARQTTGTLQVTRRVMSSTVTLVRENASFSGEAARVKGQAALVIAPHEVPVRYRISWNGLNNTYSDTPTKITFRDNAGAEALVLRFDGDKLRVFGAEEDTFARRQYSKTEPHQFNMILNMSPNPSVAMTVKEGKTPLYHTHPLELADRKFSRLDMVEIDVTSAEGSYQIYDFHVEPVY